MALAPGPPGLVNRLPSLSLRLLRYGYLRRASVTFRSSVPSMYCIQNRHSVAGHSRQDTQTPHVERYFEGAALEARVVVAGAPADPGGIAGRSNHRHDLAGCVQVRSEAAKCSERGCRATARPDPGDESRQTDSAHEARPIPSSKQRQSCCDRGHGAVMRSATRGGARYCSELGDANGAAKSSKRRPRWKWASAGG